MIPPTLPSASELAPLLAKPEQHPGSVAMICLESFHARSDCRVTVGWFTAAERRALRSALERCRQKRHAAQTSASL